MTIEAVENIELTRERKNWRERGLSRSLSAKYNEGQVITRRGDKLYLGGEYFAAGDIYEIYQALVTPPDTIEIISSIDPDERLGPDLVVKTLLREKINQDPTVSPKLRWVEGE